MGEVTRAIFSGQERQGFLQLRGKESLGLEAGFQDLEGLGQGPQPQGLEVIHHQLVFPPGFINRNAPPAQELLALLGLGAHMLVIALEEHGLKLGPGILEGEVVVAAQWLPEIGDLAAHPDQGEIGLQPVPDLPGEGAHRIDIGQFLVHNKRIILYLYHISRPTG